MNRMKRLIALLLLLVGVQAQAQTPCAAPWCASVQPLSATSVPVGGSITVTASFTSSAAVTGATLDTEIYDPTGAKVAQSWQTGVNFTAGQTIVATALAYSVSATAVPGTYTVDLGTFSSAGVSALWSASVTTFTVTAAVTGPQCLPKVQWPLAVNYGSITAGVSTRFDTYAVWVCNMPQGYLTTSSMFTLSNLAPYALQYVAGLWTSAQAAADCATTCVAPTAAELAFIAPLMQSIRPKALVSFNGASLTRSVYTANSDGTLNATPVPNESVAVGTPCDQTTRIVTAPSYYSVAGQNDQNAKPLQQGSFAVCVVSQPIGSN